MTNNDSETGTADTQHFNLSVSVDRPTFIRFMNPSRTIFFNAQAFFSYIDGWNSGFTADGPFNARMTFAMSTGYWQDRVLPSLVFVHDFTSVSGGVLPSLTYRFSQSFSATVGLAAFYGRVQDKNPALVPIGTASGGAGVGSQRSYVENGLASVRARDEVFLRIRYTF